MSVSYLKRQSVQGNIKNTTNGIYLEIFKSENIEDTDCEKIRFSFDSLINHFQRVFEERGVQRHSGRVARVRGLFDGQRTEDLFTPQDHRFLS